MRVRHVRRPLLAAALFIGTLLGLGMGCQTAREVTQRGDLDVVLSKHHINLRWGRIPMAARYVHPDLRESFSQDWGKRLQDVDLSHVEILQVLEEPGATRAEVHVRIVFVEKSTQRLRESVHLERWELIDGQWLAIKAILPDDVLGT